MRKFIAAIVVTGLVGHAFAQVQPAAEQVQNNKAYIAPDATHASEAAVGSLTPLYVGAAIVGAAVIAGASHGGGNGHQDSAAASTGGTTGTK